MPQNQISSNKQAASPIISSDSNSINDIIEVSLPPNISFNLNDPNMLRLLEQGSFVVFLLILCLFFWVLTRFVEAVKKD